MPLPIALPMLFEHWTSCVMMYRPIMRACSTMVLMMTMRHDRFWVTWRRRQAMETRAKPDEMLLEMKTVKRWTRRL